MVAEGTGFIITVAELTVIGVKQTMVPLLDTPVRLYTKVPVAVMGTVNVAVFKDGPVLITWDGPPLILYVNSKGALPFAAVNVIIGAVLFWQTVALPEIVAVEVACTITVALPGADWVHRVEEPSVTETRV